MLVRVAAAEVNPVDLWAREGLVRPATPGLEPPFVAGWNLAGTVQAPAEGFVAGQPVVGLIPWFGVAKAGIGAHAEIVSAEPGWLAPLPDGVDPVDAATLGLNAPTAMQALDLLDVGKGGTLLVVGASGAVGGYAVQLAAAAGVDVIATAGGPDDEAYLAGLGAARVLPRTAPEELAGAVRAVEPAGVDAVLDVALLGAAALDAVRDGGAFVSASAAGAPVAGARGAGAGGGRAAGRGAAGGARGGPRRGAAADPGRGDVPVRRRGAGTSAGRDPRAARAGRPDDGVRRYGRRVAEYVLRPVGRVESALRNRSDAPNQGDEGAPDCTITLDPEYATAGRDLAAGSELLVLTWLDRARREVQAVRPRGDPDRPETGVFSTRSPDRPNPIGLHRVTVLAVDGTRLRVRGLEALDGTPVVDLKPPLGPVTER